ncbi:arsenate reductase [Maritalea mobilis]|uniref:arsenate reductase family protein n=1 Tax=Maritalea mobilis TaxID=483324 RepID=UPI001C93EF27|nr:ArsC/Spx/MgsR family protein [Maritalea mobilis]MBY6202330.1 arsenate reductase [Maritalea mobilis]
MTVLEKGALMIVYGLKACDTCRKAVKALQGAGHEVRLVDVRAEPLTAAQIEAFVAAFGDKIVNRRSTTWRGLSEEDRALPEAEIIAAHPSVMKRPVIEAGETLYLGWDAGVRDALT